MQEPKAGRRIVSRGEYVRVQTKKTGMWLKVLMFLVFGVTVFNMGYHRNFLPDLPVLGSIICIIGAMSFLWIAQRTVQRVRAIEPVVPLTRANTADLPVPDTLVRASQEPAQAQEGVLLRAASGEAQAGQEGQLLRASVGGAE